MRRSIRQRRECLIGQPLYRKDSLGEDAKRPPIRALQTPKTLHPAIGTAGWQLEFEDQIRERAYPDGLRTVPTDQDI